MGRGSPNGLVEDALEVPLGQGGALEVLAGADVAGAGQSLLVGDGLHTLGAQGVERGGVLAQIELGADQDDGDVGCVVVDLGVPLQRWSASDGTRPGRRKGTAEAYLGLYVVKRRRADDGEADEEDVGLRV